jgi:hypothetical protein
VGLDFGPTLKSKCVLYVVSLTGQKDQQSTMWKLTTMEHGHIILFGNPWMLKSLQSWYLISYCNLFHQSQITRIDRFVMTVQKKKKRKKELTFQGYTDLLDSN